MKTYGEIYGAFEPIFQWIRKNYPSGGFFIVDADSARFYCGNPEIYIVSERMKKPLGEQPEVKAFWEDVKTAFAKAAESASEAIKTEDAP